MAAAYIDRANATQNPEFRLRVRVAITQVATSIQGDNAGAPTVAWQKRQALALRVIQMPAGGDEVLDWFVWMLVSWGALADPLSATDGDLFSATNAAWNDVAGVSASDA